MSDNDQEPHKKLLADEVLRKVGRNVILFQQIELLLSVRFLELPMATLG